MDTNKEELLENEAENIDNKENIQQPEEEQKEKEKSTKKSIFGKKTSKEESLKQKIEELEEEKNNLNDKFLRLFSEFENYKKRTNKEKLDLIATASERVLVSLLPIIDDFERANQHNKNVEDAAALKEGFELIYSKMVALLKKYEVEEIAAKGENFDTDLHEAITHFPAQDEEMKGKVMDVVEKGYKLKDKVIRFAKVVIAN